MFPRNKLRTTQQVNEEAVQHFYVILGLHSDSFQLNATLLEEYIIIHRVLETEDIRLSEIKIHYAQNPFVTVTITPPRFVIILFEADIYSIRMIISRDTVPLP